MIGQNGSGKSTLLKLLAGIFRPSQGEVAIGGTVSSLLELGAGFHPEFTGRENVYLNGAIFGLSSSYIDEHIDEILDFAEIAAFADQPVRTYSSGMFLRLGFSVAMHVNPDVLLLDEVFAVGDEAFSKKCYGRIFDFKRAGRRSSSSRTTLRVSRCCAIAPLLARARSRRGRGRRSRTSCAPTTGGSRVDGVGALGAGRRVGHAGAEIVEASIIDNAGNGTDIVLEGHRVQSSRSTSCRPVDAPRARVAFVFRDAAGKVLAGRTGRLDLLGGQINTINLVVHEGAVPRGPLHSRRRRHDGDGSEELARVDRLLAFTVLSDDAEGIGPIKTEVEWGVTALPARADGDGRAGPFERLGGSDRRRGGTVELERVDERLRSSRSRSQPTAVRRRGTHRRAIPARPTAVAGSRQPRPRSARARGPAGARAGLR